jgi:hypothetical protein
MNIEDLKQIEEVVRRVVREEINEQVSRELETKKANDSRESRLRLERLKMRGAG